MLKQTSRPSGNTKLPVAVHDGENSIRAQSTKAKTVPKPKQDAADRAGMSKDVQKAVLASPLTVAWPDIPRHLQTTVLHRMKELVPGEVADYHVARARCHQKEKRRKRVVENLGEKAVGDKEDGQDEGTSTGDGDETGKKRKRALNDDQSRALPTRPEKPQILSHLVLGINEVIKALERQIDELKLQILVMGDTLNGDQPGRPPRASDFLPTAPRSPSPLSSSADDQDDDDERVDKGKEGGPRLREVKPLAPVSFIVIPLLSINPQSLVSPIPQYCATYNALVYQHQHLAKIVQTRTKKTDWASVIGQEREEVRVVPLGNVEHDLARLVGLRRAACVALRGSHPDIERIRDILPKSVLHPPRHSLTLPCPTSALKIHTTAENGPPSAKSGTQRKGQGPVAPIAHVHYAPLHVKGLQTKVPVDNASRKAKRIEEVRKKRAEAKIKKKEEKKRG